MGIDAGKEAETVLVIGPVVTATELAVIGRGRVASAE